MDVNYKLKSISDILTREKVITSTPCDDGDTILVDQSKDFIIGKCKSSDFYNGEHIVVGDHTLEINYIDKPFCVMPNTVVCSVNDNYNPYYVFKIIQKYKFRFCSSGYSRKYNQLLEGAIPIPEYNIQNTLGRISKLIDDEIKLLKDEIYYLEQKKKYYLNKIFC